MTTTRPQAGPGQADRPIPYTLTPLAEALLAADVEPGDLDAGQAGYEPEAGR